MFTASETRMFLTKSDEAVELWFVVGVEREAYPTKIAAEVAARLRWPDIFDTNSAVYFRTFLPRD